MSLKTSDLLSDSVLCLYNISRDGFFVGGNDWNAQASIDKKHAYKVILRRWKDDFGQWDGETYLITDSVERGGFKGKYRNVFIECNKKVFVDQDSAYTPNRDILWRIIPKDGEEDVYNIFPSPHNKDFGPDLQLCASAALPNTLPVVGLFNAGTRSGGDWCFVVPSDAEEYMKQNNREKKVPDMIFEQTIKSFAMDSVPVEQVVYLYNPSFDGFIIGANQWYSRASLSKERAYKVVLHKYLDEHGQWDGESYLITDSVEAGTYSGVYRNMFIEYTGEIWVDQQYYTEYADHIWSIIPSEEGGNAFIIRPSNKNRVFTTDNLTNWCLGVDQPQNNFNPLVILKYRNTDTTTDWQFLTQEQYDRVQIERKRQQLRDLLEDIQELFHEIDVTRARRICEDKESSLANIEKEIGTARLLILSDTKDSVEGTDFTPLLNNPNYTYGGMGWSFVYNIDGSITWRGGNHINPCSESWQASFDVSQMVTDLPDGLYRVDAQAFARTRFDDLAWIERDSSYVIPVLYANEMIMPISNLMNTTFPNREEYPFLVEDVMDGVEVSIPASWLTMDGNYVIRNLDAASLAFAKGFFDQSLYCIVEDGHLKIGIRAYNKNTGSWTVWDNFRLLYLPETPENYKKAVRCHIEKAKEMEYLWNNKDRCPEALSMAIQAAEASLAINQVDILRKALSDINGALLDARNKYESIFCSEPLTRRSLFRNLTESKERENMSEHEKIEEFNRQKDVLQKAMANSYMTIVDMWSREDEWEQAVQMYLKAIETCDEFDYEEMAEVLDNICYKLFAKEMQGKALELWNKQMDLWESIDDFPNLLLLSGGYKRVGDLNEYCNNHKEAEIAYVKGIDTAKKALKMNSLKREENLLAPLYNGLAYSQAHQQNYEAALTSIEHAIKIVPDDPNLYDTKGEILYLSGDIGGAREMWKKVISLDSGFGNSGSNLYKYIIGLQ